MKVIQVSKYEMNYLINDGSYILDEHTKWCYDFSYGFGKVEYNNHTYNFVNSDGKRLLKHNVNCCFSFNEDGFAEIKINNVLYYIDSECNFYNSDKVSFKEMYKVYLNMISKLKDKYKLYHHKQSELIEIIDKYTYFDVEEYFI